MKIGYRIKNLRIENKLTQQQLADMLSISQQAYSKYENNKVLLPIKILCKLAEFIIYLPTIF